MDLVRRKSLDDRHLSATFRTAPERARVVGKGCFWFYLRLRYRAEQLKAKRQESGAPAVSQKAEVTDTNEALGEQVQQEAAQELIQGQAPGFLDRLRVEEPQSREPLRHSGRGQLSLPEQIRLLFADVLRSERIGWAPVISHSGFPSVAAGGLGRCPLWESCDAGVTQNLPSLPRLTSLTLHRD